MNDTPLWSATKGTWACEAGTVRVECHPLFGLKLIRPMFLEAFLGLEIVDAHGLGPKLLAAPGTAPDVVNRADTLLAQFLPNENRPVECHCRWRVQPGIFDLEVSTHTPGIWDGLAVQTSSIFSSGEVCILDDVSPAIVLYRPENGTLSYTEFCHPHDGIDMVATPFANGSTRIRFQLFGHDLEKGVILRGRLRGVILDRTDDEQQAREAYKTFLAETPNLTL